MKKPCPHILKPDQQIILFYLIQKLFNLLQKIYKN